MKKERTVFTRRAEESWHSFARRCAESTGELLVVLSPMDGSGISPEDRGVLLGALAPLHERLLVATRDASFATEARRRGIRVVDKSRALRQILSGHPSRDEALRHFSPSLWQQHLRSRLQTMGLLSLPRLRVWFLILLSTRLFAFVFFRLLPSADIRVWPRRDGVNQTMNVYLVQSGATLDIPTHVRTRPLFPLTVHIKHTITFDQVSKEFIGTSAEVPMTIVNKSDQVYSLRKGTRIANQAGMVFRMQEPLNIQPGAEVTIKTKADTLDLYGEIIGERGNVPAGLRWEFPGLAQEERKLVYGENRVPAKGGTTGYRNVLQASDLELARKKLEQELLASAKQMVEEERIVRNAKSSSGTLRVLSSTHRFDEMQRVAFSEFNLPTTFLGQPVTSVPVKGAITYTIYTYDAQETLALLSKELGAHITQGKRLLPDSLDLDRLVVHVIDYAPDFAWIKTTVDLTGTEQYILDPLTPTGARFGQDVREKVAGLSTDDATRIIQNLPEVERVEIHPWPPWDTSLPTIPSSIAVTPQ